MPEPIYASDPNQAPDSQFVAGGLTRLVAGNRGRRLDPRRTPMQVTRVDAEHGEFEVEIGAFEDAGARWVLPLSDATRFQFARDSQTNPASAVTELHRAQDRFNVPLVIEVDPACRTSTITRILTQQREAATWLANHDPPDLDLPAAIASRTGNPRLAALLSQFLVTHGGLDDLDRVFSETFVSNPESGELVAGHAIVLAELGLTPYRGLIPRHPELFDGELTRARRAEHIITRLAFMRALWPEPTVALHRGAAASPRDPASFVSATFSETVARAHRDAASTGRMWNQAVPRDRIFMTFLETAALSDRFLEAEAVLIADPGNRAF